MTASIGDLVRKHHRALLEGLTRHVEALESGDANADDRRRLVGLLTEDLLPHAMGEERHFYPVVDDLVRKHERPTAPMSVEHQHIERYIHAIDELVERLGEASAEERPELERRLRVAARELLGVVRVHTDKEERVYLPLVERHLSAAEQDRIVKGIHDPYAGGGDGSSRG